MFARRSSMPPIIRCSERMSRGSWRRFALHPQNPSVAVGIVGNQLVVADTPMPKASAGMAELIKRLRITRSSGLPSIAAPPRRK